MTAETMTPEAVQQTQQDYLRVATNTGHLAGAHVEFSMDGSTWADVIVGEQHPAAARATVHRVGHVIPTIATVLWDEVVPAEENWRALWLRKPHVLFGAFVLRTALRRAFADVLSDRREPDDAPLTPPAAAAAPAEPETAAEPVDWLALVDGADTAEAVAAVRARARAARAVTIDLRAAMQRRLGELVDAAQPRTPADREVWTAPAAPADAAPRPKPTARPAAPERPTAVAEAYREAEERKAATTAPTAKTKRTRRSSTKGDRR